MSFAACKTMHCPTGIENCASGFITHSAAEITPQIQTADVDSDWPATKPVGPMPNLVVSAGNVLEVYLIRVEQASSRDAAEVVKRGGLMAGISAASLELVCTYRLHGNIYSMGVITAGGADGGKRRDSIILSFEDAKMSVLEFDDATHGLRTSSMHFFEGPDWFHLKRGRESFDKGPIIKVDPQGRCAGVFAFEQQMIVLKAAEVNSSLAGEDSAFSAGGASARIESSYIITLRDLDVRHVKDFTFLHGYIEPVMVILHERELTWSGRVSWKHHTCMVSAFSISTTLKQHPLIWSAANLPHDAYKLLAVPSPIGGVLVIGANTIHYHSQSSSCSLALNNFAFFGDNSQEMPRSSFNVELDAANATWLTSDVAMLSTKTGELLLLTIIYDGRIVQKLDLSKSRASVLTSGITTIGDSLFFLGSRLGDSLLVQFSCGLGGSNLPPGVQEEVGDIESDAPSAKRLRMSSSDALQDMINGEELSLYGTAPNNAQSAQKTFSFAVRDSLINVGPLKDFSYGMRINADLNATGIAKQSNYELVCCSGHGKNGSLCVLQQSIRPETITQEALPGCKGIWTVYHKNTRIHLSESSRMADEEDEYHAYLIISLEARTMVLQTANNLEEVTENVDYYVQGTTLAAGNLFGRRRVIQVFAHGARILDGAFMTQELSFKASNVESGSSLDTSIVASVSIADPYVLLRMTNGSLQLLVGDPSSCSVSLTVPSVFESSKKSISACTLYHDKGPEPWLRKTSTDAWLSSGMGEAIDGADGVTQDQGDVYCVVCYENGTLEIFDVPNFTCVFSVDKFISGRTYLVDTFMQDSVNGLHAHSKNTEEVIRTGQKENSKDVKINVVELMMHRWIGKHSRPFLFGILADGTILSYHAYVFEGSENSSKVEGSVSSQNSISLSSTNASRLRNLRFVRVPVDNYAREEMPSGTQLQRMNVYKNIGGSQGIFLTGSRPSWFMVFRERLRIHPQLCDGPIVAFTVLHNVNCNHGLIYVTALGTLKICQLPSFLSYDNYWPVQKIPLKGTPHQVAYFAEKNFMIHSKMAATTTLLPNSISPFFTNSPYFAITHVTNVPFLNNNPSFSARKSGIFCPNAKKKNPWLDPFDYGDDPEMEYGSLFSEGKQDEDPRPPDNPDNPYGFLKFPMGYSVEIASLGLKIRGDVRRCCCVIDGGVYENLLFFPAIQMIKDRYPGVQVDILATARGKQTFEMNKNVRWANAYDLDDDFPEPAEYTDMVGILKSRYYDMILSTKLAGIGHAVFLFMSTARDRVSYIYPNVNSAGAGLFLSETFTPETMNLSEGGYHMYRQMIDWLGRPARKVPRQPLPPLKVSISRKVREVVEAKYKNVGAQKGKYIVIHGIKSDSKASMQSRGDTDSLLPIEIWAEIAEEIRGVKPVFVIPHEKERENVEDAVGYDASIVFITTPGQLAALVDDSAGVIATNTAAIQLAHARGKPSIGLFCSEDKARSFVPNAEAKKCATISSKTGKLVDIDVEAVKNAVQIFTMPLAIF